MIKRLLKMCLSILIRKLVSPKPSSENLNHKKPEKKGKTPEVLLLLERLISDWVQEERRRNLGCCCHGKGGEAV